MLDFPITFGPTLGECDFQRIRRRMALDFYKWDSQIGDTGTLFRQPLLINPDTWQKLKHLGESLAAELMVAEEELLHRPELHPLLGLPRALRSHFKRARLDQLPPCPVRILRFDFHYTTQGWRISEVNSDVPGGYTEASNFTRMMAESYPGTRVTGIPAEKWAFTMASVAGDGGHVALLSAPGFLEDQQITAFLAHQLQSRNIGTSLVHDPSQFRWINKRAYVSMMGKNVELGAIVRFYQGEWLANLPGESGWQLCLFGGKTPITNSVTALLSESKRFPLTWNMLSAKMSTWKALLPQCRDPKIDHWKQDDSWILKAAFSNTGDEVHMQELTSRRKWETLCRIVGKNP